MDKDVGINWLAWDENRCNRSRGGSRCRGGRGGSRRRGGSGGTGDGVKNGGHGPFFSVLGEREALLVVVVLVEYLFVGLLLA